MYLHDSYFLEMANAINDGTSLCKVDTAGGRFVVDMCALAKRIQENLRRFIMKRTLYFSIRDFF